MIIISLIPLTSLVLVNIYFIKISFLFFCVRHRLCVFSVSYLCSIAGSWAWATRPGWNWGAGCNTRASWALFISCGGYLLIFFNELLINHEDRKLWERMAQISKEQCREGITVFLCLFLFMSLLEASTLQDFISLLAIGNISKGETMLCV